MWGRILAGNVSLIFYFLLDYVLWHYLFSSAVYSPNLVLGILTDEFSLHSNKTSTRRS